MDRSDKQCMEILTRLECHSTYCQSLDWNDDSFYFKLLFTVGLSNRRKDKYASLRVLTLLEQQLTTRQLNYLKQVMHGWKLDNMLREDFCVKLDGNEEMVMFRNDGTPFLFSGKTINHIKVLTYKELSWSLCDDDDDDEEFLHPGVQVGRLNQFIYGNCNGGDGIGKKEALVWEDVTSLISDKTRWERARKIHPYEYVRQTRYMSDMQHVELVERKRKEHYKKISEWRPNICWNWEE